MLNRVESSIGSDRHARAGLRARSAHFDPKCDDDFSVGLKRGKVDGTHLRTKKADAVPQAANLL